MKNILIKIFVLLILGTGFTTGLAYAFLAENVAHYENIFAGIFSLGCLLLAYFFYRDNTPRKRKFRDDILDD